MLLDHDAAELRIHHTNDLWLGLRGENSWGTGLVCRPKKLQKEFLMNASYSVGARFYSSSPSSVGDKGKEKGGNILV